MQLLNEQCRNEYERLGPFEYKEGAIAYDQTKLVHKPLILLGEEDDFMGC